MQPKDISDLQAVVRAMQGCESIYRRTEFVREVFQGNIAWDGLVRVFKLINHSKAKYCYAWSYREGTDTKYAAVVEIAPVNAAQSAVKAAKASNGLRKERIAAEICTLIRPTVAGKLKNRAWGRRRRAGLSGNKKDS